MRRIFTSLLGILVFCVVAACAEKPVDMSSVKTKEGGKVKFHGDMSGAPAVPPKSPIAERLKNNKLVKYPQKTIGEAFDGYSKAASKEWREELGRDKLFVDYIAWFPETSVPRPAKEAGVQKWGLDIKFAIDEDGYTYITLVSKLYMMKDGSIQAIPLGASYEPIIDAIYTGQEISFR